MSPETMFPHLQQQMGKCWKSHPQKRISPWPCPLLCRAFPCWEDQAEVTSRWQLEPEAGGPRGVPGSPRPSLRHPRARRLHPRPRRGAAPSPPKAPLPTAACGTIIIINKRDVRWETGRLSGRSHGTELLQQQQSCFPSSQAEERFQGELRC